MADDSTKEVVVPTNPEMAAIIQIAFDVFEGNAMRMLRDMRRGDLTGAAEELRLIISTVHHFAEPPVSSKDKGCTDQEAAKEIRLYLANAARKEQDYAEVSIKTLASWRDTLNEVEP